MPSVEPFQAWFFYGADDYSEVQSEYERVNAVLRPGGVQLQPELTIPVTVIAVEYRPQRGEYVWFINGGEIMSRESWQIQRGTRMTYDPVPYWNDQAASLAGPGAASPEHERQEAALEKLLRPLKWSSVLEVGVGGGRIADLLHRIRPDAEYTGLDIGQVQLDAGKRVWPDGEFILSAIEKFKVVPSDRQWDLVIVSEVLMHVKPRDIRRAIGNVLAASRRHVVIVEWDAQLDDLTKPIASFNFPHDYRKLLGPVYRPASETRTDRQVIFHVKP